MINKGLFSIFLATKVCLNYEDVRVGLETPCTDPLNWSLGVLANKKLHKISLLLDTLLLNYGIQLSFVWFA